MEEETVLTNLLGNAPKVKLIELLLLGRHFDYCISDMAEYAGVARSTIYRMLDDMLKNEIIKPTRKLGRIQLYKLNQENPEVKLMLTLFKELLKINSEKEIARQTMRIKVKAAKN